jgi:DNA-binding helix-hairpin-helix protein with protein kinase domain
MFEQLIKSLLNNLAQQHVPASPKPAAPTPSYRESEAMQTITVYNAQKTPQVLNTAFANGGEGTVYPLASRPDEVLVKIYHNQVLTKLQPALQNKIAAMMQYKPQDIELLSWPAIAVYNQQGEWIGYAMRRKQGLKLQFLAHAILYKKHFPHFNRCDIVQVLLNLISQVKQLHTHNIMIGDYNLNNFLCDPQSKKISFIDCDSYQCLFNGQHFSCPVGSPDMTPPEHHNQHFKDIVRTPQSEAFSLAIILFKCLMLGRHPYDMVNGEDPVSNMLSGRFAYGKGNQGIPKGDWYNIWSHMPYQLKSMFILTFSEGALNPHKRPSLDEWHQVLALYLKEMDKGWHEVAVRPAQAKNGNYRGHKPQN